MARAASASSVRLTRDDAAEGRDRSRRRARGIGCRRASSLGDAAGIGVLDDDAGGGARRVEFGDAFIGRVGVVDVVVGQLLALQLARGGDARRACRACGRRRPAGAGSRRSAASGSAGRRRRGSGASSLRAARRTSSRSRRHRRRCGHRPWRRGGGAARSVVAPLLAAISSSTAVIVRGLDDDGDIVVVLRGGADHRRAADVDVLDAVLVAGALGDRRLERIEVDHEQVDRRDAVRLHGLGMVPGCRGSPSRPPCTLGCSVLTRPSIISGKPVSSRDVLDREPGRRDRLARCRRWRRARRHARPAPWRIRPGRSCRKRTAGRGLRGGSISHGQGPQGILMPRRAAVTPALPDGAPSKVASRARAGWLAAFGGVHNGGGAAVPGFETA